MTFATVETRNLDPVSGLALVELLLAEGADPNMQVSKPTPVRRWSHDFALMDRWNGATPFWLAAKFLETDMMRVLVAAGARHAAREPRWDDAPDDRRWSWVPPGWWQRLHHGVAATFRRTTLWLRQKKVRGFLRLRSVGHERRWRSLSSLAVT